MTYGYDPNRPPPPPVPPQQQASGYYGYAPPSQHYAPHPPPAPRRSGKRLALILGVTLGASVLLCGGGFALLAYFGMNLVETEVRNLVRDHPVVVEHIGEIQRFEVNLTESGAVDDADTFVYEVSGTKGRGMLTVKHVTNDAGDEEILSATLRLPSGQEHDLAME